MVCGNRADPAMMGVYGQWEVGGGWGIEVGLCGWKRSVLSGYLRSLG